MRAALKVFPEGSVEGGEVSGCVSVSSKFVTEADMILIDNAELLCA